jgi:secondary thiamine-phosphate synthase enzyme
MTELRIESKDHSIFIPITQQIQKVLEKEGWKDGIVTIFVPHTTAGITIQENADPDVVEDLLYLLDKIAPWKDSHYHHVEGNTAAHLKASMMGTSAQCFVRSGKLQLGTWQGIFFCEFDGPRDRKVWITFTKSE